MKDIQQIKIIVRGIEEMLNRESRESNLKQISRSIELVLGRIERVEDKQKALEEYLGVEFIKQSKYKKR